MTIKAVFRVQCDGPCHGWLSEAGEVVAAYGSVTVRVIGHWPSEHAARVAALNNGWTPHGGSERDWATALWRCPACRSIMLASIEGEE